MKIHTFKMFHPSMENKFFKRKIPLWAIRKVSYVSGCVLTVICWYNKMDWFLLLGFGGGEQSATLHTHTHPEVKHKCSCIFTKVLNILLTQRQLNSGNVSYGGRRQRGTMGSKGAWGIVKTTLNPNSRTPGTGTLLWSLPARRPRAGHFSSHAPICPDP